MSSELIHEFLVELRDPANPLRSGSQERRPKMQRAILLPKPVSRNNAHARRVQQPTAVELIRRFPRLLRGRARLLRDRDRREEIHRPLRRLARHALHLGEGFVESLCAVEQTFEDGVVFGFIEVV